MTEARTIAVITGTRADYGLLKPVMRAIADSDRLDLLVFVTGTHLLEPHRTIDEVKHDFEVDATIPMQMQSRSGRLEDAAALGRGISGMTDVFRRTQPDVVLVLGDRIEAFAAAAAAAVAGIHVAHVHGGDRAEGIADESMRHAVTKLAHIHFPATAQSADRIARLGEDPHRIHTVGSPAIDCLTSIPALADDEYTALGEPRIVFLLHPCGDAPQTESDRARRLLGLCAEHGRVLALAPNHDAGREGIVEAIAAAGCATREHLPRTTFVGTLLHAGTLVGNSSAGLIEAAALGVRCINVGRRQSGREMPDHVSDIPSWDLASIDDALRRALAAPRHAVAHPYGDGCAGARIAEVLGSIELAAHAIVKRNTY